MHLKEQHKGASKTEISKTLTELRDDNITWIIDDIVRHINKNIALITAKLTAAYPLRQWELKVFPRHLADQEDKPCYV